MSNNIYRNVSICDIVFMRVKHCASNIVRTATWNCADLISKHVQIEIRVTRDECGKERFLVSLLRPVSLVIHWISSSHQH